MKFKNLINAFNKNNLKTVDKEQEQHDFAILRNYIFDVFQTEKQIDLNQCEVDCIHDLNDFTIANLRRDDDRPKHIYKEEFLPYNTQNDEWLVHYIKKIIKNDIKISKQNEKEFYKINKKFNQNTKVVNDKKFSKFLLEEEYKEFTLVNSDHKIPDKTILKFIQTDEEFNDARTAYTLDLTRAQIEYSMNADNEPNEVLMHHKYERTNPHSVEVLYHPANSRFEKNTDKLFRNAMFTGLTENLGLDPHTVELGLEKYAPLWREQTMIMAFDNEYGFKAKDKASMNYKDWLLGSFYNKFRGLWVRKRQHEYGKEYESIIKEAGSETPSMQLSPKKFNLLSNQVSAMENRLRTMIKSFIARQIHQNDDRQI